MRIFVSVSYSTETPTEAKPIWITGINIGVVSLLLGEMTLLRG